MKWLLVIVVVGIIGAVIGYMSEGNAEDAAQAGLGAAFGCGTIIFRIFIGVLSLYFVISLFGWLFGGCS